jgi:hypothetical protein
VALQTLIGWALLASLLVALTAVCAGNQLGSIGSWALLYRAGFRY